MSTGTTPSRLVRHPAIIDLLNQRKLATQAGNSAKVEAINANLEQAGALCDYQQDADGRWYEVLTEPDLTPADLARMTDLDDISVAEILAALEDMEGGV